MKKIKVKNNKLITNRNIIIALLFLALIMVFLFYIISAGSTKNEPPIIVQNKIINPVASFVTTVQNQSGPGLPVRLKIPKINVDAKFETVGLTAQGAVDVPKDFTDVAWYNLSPIPGETGSAIITGHYGFKDGRPSAFDNLHKVRVGDKLYVEDAKGNSISFVVREIRRYDQNSSALAVFNQKDEGAHLNLITCEGTWDKDLKSYSSRLVIFTDRE